MGSNLLLSLFSFGALLIVATLPMMPNAGIDVSNATLGTIDSSLGDGMQLNHPTAKTFNRQHFSFVNALVGVFYTDTIKIPRDTIGIEEVVVKREVLTPEEQFERNKKEYRIIYLHGDNSKIVEGFSIFPPAIVLNINKIYNHFSASGKRARRFQQVLEDDFMQDKVRESWHPLTQKLTRLEGQELEDFRRYYQPEFAWWVRTEEYERLDYVFKKLKTYRDSSVYIREYLLLPPKASGLGIPSSVNTSFRR